MKRHAAKLIFILFLIDAALFLICIAMGAVGISSADLLDIVIGKGRAEYRNIIVYVRIPRVAACALTGSGLAVAGAVIQNVLQNPLASPNVIGVNAGAGMAVVMCSAFFPLSYSWIPFAAFVGALGAMLFIYLLACKTGASRMTLILSGVCVNSLLNAAADAVHVFWNDAWASAYGFRLGGFDSVNIRTLIPAGIVIVGGCAAVFVLEKELEVLSLGKSIAASVGLNTTFFQFFFLILAAALAGACVSIAGLLGFVGLIAPHVSRRMVGEECRFLLPVCALSGACLVMFCDLLARTLWKPFEVPTGILLSFVGAPFFLHLLFRRKSQKRKRNHD